MPVIVYIGSVTYYNCSGTTACGDFCDSLSYHVAYPNVIGHPPDYSNQVACGGGGMVAVPCSSSIRFINLCNPSISNLVPVSDHGPGAACRLDSLFCDPPGTYVVRRADFTRSAYWTMGGGPQGWIPCQIEVTVP